MLLCVRVVCREEVGEIFGKSIVGCVIIEVSGEC
jgi:hypothetical protein